MIDKEKRRMDSCNYVQDVKEQDFQQLNQEMRWKNAGLHEEYLEVTKLGNLEGKEM